jgi:hypothetical protein
MLIDSDNSGFATMSRTIPTKTAIRDAQRDVQKWIQQSTYQF